MNKPGLLCIGDRFILPELMRSKLGLLENRFKVTQACTPFPLEPYRDIAEVREASGSEEQMIEALRGVSVCIAHHAPLTRRVLEHASDLELFIVCRGGPVNVNLAAATAKNVLVGFTPARNAAATAEHTVAMILSAMRGIPSADASLHRGEWKGDYTYASAGLELGTATVGLIGYGSIGRIMGRILCGFGARILACDPLAKIDSAELVQQVSLEELLDRADVISLHARAGKNAAPILGRREFARMRKGAVVVNCARGSLMDYEAMAEALRTGRLFAAAVDVFPVEPLPAESPLLKLPNFFATPHIAGGTRNAAEKATAIAAQELQRFVNGEPLRYCANPEVGAATKSSRGADCSS